MNKADQERWDRFAEELVIDFNLGQAYLRAGNKCKPESARHSGCRLLSTNVHVQKKVAELLQERKKATGYDREQAEQEYEQFRKIALTKKDVKGGVAAVTGKAKLYALLTDTVKFQRSLAQAVHEAMNEK